MASEPRDPWLAARRHTWRLGLRLTPAERLSWLEETLAEMQSLLGRARKLPPGSAPPAATPAPAPDPAAAAGEPDAG